MMTISSVYLAIPMIFSCTLDRIEKEPTHLNALFIQNPPAVNGSMLADCNSTPIGTFFNISTDDASDQYPSTGNRKSLGIYTDIRVRGLFSMTPAQNKKVWKPSKGSDER